jgi:hypothetical protein
MKINTSHTALKWVAHDHSPNLQWSFAGKHNPNGWR